MAKKFGFFNSINGDRKYLATDISQAFDVAVTTGLQAIPDSFKVVPNDGMTVKMLPGGCMIYGAFCVDHEDEIIELDVADGELNRIDRIVMRYDRFERSIKTVVIKGTPALNPTAPAPLRNENQFDLVLADIRVNKAVTGITAANITDMRYSELCGFIGVKGAVTQEEFDGHVGKTAADDVHGLNWEEYTELTLLNGWSGVLRYRKNGMDLVWIYGEITPGVTTLGTTIANIPSGYRPPQVMALPARSANIAIGGIVGLAITTAGNLNIYGSAVDNIGTAAIRINYVYKAV